MDTADISGSTGALVPLEGLTALQIFAPGAVDPLLEKIRTEVRAVATDVSTPAGRKAIASLAYKVARSKTLLDEMGKGLVSDWKTRASTVDSERRRIRDELDALRDEVRKPLDDYEAAEEQRIAAHEAALAEIENRSAFTELEPSVELIRARIAALQEPDGRDWQEFAKRVADAKARGLAILHGGLASAERLAAELAEQERLRAEEAERARLDAIRLQEEREARIAAEAAEAARIKAERVAREAAEAEARRVEEARLAAQRQAEAAARAAEEERQRVEREKAEAEARAEKAEADRLAAERRAEAAAKEAARRAKEARVAAAKREMEAADAAAKAERERIEQERQAAAAETARREADKKHRQRVNLAALADLIAAGVTDDMAKAAITAIAKGAIRHIAITY